MDSWKGVKLSEEEEIGVTAEDLEPEEEDQFQRSLAGKLWTSSAYNIRAFKQSIVEFWKLKNPVEIQDLGKNLYLFRFAAKRDLEYVLKNGPWSFDRNILVLKRTTGIEQPSEMKMSTMTFWARIYDLPLKLRTESMAKKIGDVIGKFEETDPKDHHRLGRFLRIKVEIDLTKPMKRGTVVRFQGKDLRVFFKFERLPIFCFVCGRIGHQIRECEETDAQDGEGFEEIEEKELPFGPWLRASPLPRNTYTPKHDSGSSSCSKNLFACSSTSKVESVGDKTEEVEVEQTKLPNIEKHGEKILAIPSTAETTVQEIDVVAKTLGSVDLSTKSPKSKKMGKEKSDGKGKWSRLKGRSGSGKQKQPMKKIESGKRQLVDVIIADGTPEELRVREQKKLKDSMEVDTTLPEGVLDVQHLLPQ